jgi:ribonuclease HI
MDSVGPAVIVYTDGACRGNPGPGGWAWAVPGGAFASGADPHTTNQRMEITAALEALRALVPDATSDIEVVSDSTYVVNCFKDRWWQGWQRRNWKNSQNKPVANRDLWEPLIELAVASAPQVTFRWVKGHSGDRWNDRVDELATAAADRGSGQSGPGG